MSLLRHPQLSVEALPLHDGVERILDNVQMHLAGFLVLCAQIVDHMVDCVPGENFEHL